MMIMCHGLYIGHANRTLNTRRYTSVHAFCSVQLFLVVGKGVTILYGLFSTMGDVLPSNDDHVQSRSLHKPIGRDLILGVVL